MSPWLLIFALAISYGIGVGYTLVLLLIFRFLPAAPPGDRVRVDWARLPVWLLVIGPVIYLGIRVWSTLQDVLEVTGVLLLLVIVIGAMILGYAYAGMTGYLIIGVSVLASIAILWHVKSSPARAMGRWTRTLARSPTARVLQQWAKPWLSPPIRRERDKQ